MLTQQCFHSAGLQALFVHFSHGTSSDISKSHTAKSPRNTFGKWLIFKGGLEENTSYTIFHVTLSVLNSEKYGIIGGKYMIHWVSVFPPN